MNYLVEIFKIFEHMGLLQTGEYSLIVVNALYVYDSNLRLVQYFPQIDGTLFSLNYLMLWNQAEVSITEICRLATPMYVKKRRA